MSASNTKLEQTCRRLLEGNTYAEYNHIRLASVDMDRVEVYVDLEPAFKNIYGMAHGGLLCTLMDTCAGLTARLDERRHVTLDMNIHYLSYATEGRITAVSRVIKRGRTVCVMDVTATNAEGRLLAEGMISFFSMDG